MAQEDSEFPAITICKNPHGYKDTVLKSHGINGHNHYDGSHKYSQWSSNDSNIDENQLFDMATYTLDELLKSATVRSFKHDVNISINL